MFDRMGSRQPTEGETFHNKLRRWFGRPQGFPLSIYLILVPYALAIWFFLGALAIGLAVTLGYWLGMWLGLW